MRRNASSTTDADSRSLFDSPAVLRAHTYNKVLDVAARYLIAFGGLGVIVAVLLIAFFLVHEVVPLFERARISPVSRYAVPLPEAGESIYIAAEEHGQVGFRLTAAGRVVFFAVADGAVLKSEQLPLGAGVHISRLALDSERSRLLALGLSDGSVLMIRHNYRVSYADGGRRISPEISFPYGRDRIELLPDQPVTALAVREGEDELMVVGQHGGMTRGVLLPVQPDYLSGKLELVVDPFALPELPVARRMLLSPDQRRLFLLDDGGRIHVAQHVSGTFPGITQVITAERGQLLDMAWLLGGQSIVATADDGTLSQWFMVRASEAGGHGHLLQWVRQFEGGNAPLRHLAVEQRRKGFVTLDGAGNLAIFNATAARRLLLEPLIEQRTTAFNLSPRADTLLVETADRQLAIWQVRNRHPEVSWSVLWGKVWYESYAEPEYVWQSSAAGNDFEPKLSLMPLVFGTLKAAFYAMLIAAPLALCGAIFTAYFMAPAMRTRIKPLIELMEALPTVILGLLAGLWLAPLLETNMLAVLAILLLLPLSTLVTALIWHHLPLAVTRRVPDGWQAALLIPPLMLAGYLCFLAAPLVEKAAFGGDFLAWLTQDLGVGFDQRNALVVGIAMGFAVIPTIFSIAEDAVFSVPRHLSMASLALGARPWQTLVGVVLPIASPGLFSALMIGFGRAVGETMIVLMATGNTPIMDFNMFEGMRTLAANIAVEVPEAEVGSSHYRVLFLAAFVLFCFTFLFNAVAEVLRQGLREKYGKI